MKVRILMTAALGLCLISAHAQEKPVVNLRFLFLDETAGAFEAEIDNEFRQVNAYPYQISAPYPIAPGTRIPIYKQVQTPEGERRIQIATVAPSATSGSVLAVLASQPNPGNSANPGQYEVVYFDSDDSEFTAGSVRAYNLGQSRMALAIGENRSMLEPGDTETFDVNPDEKYRFFVRVAEQTPDKWQMLYDSVAILRPDERMTGVLVFSPSGMKHTFTAAELAIMGDPKPSHYWLTFTEKVEAQ